MPSSATCPGGFPCRFMLVGLTLLAGLEREVEWMTRPAAERVSSVDGGCGEHCAQRLCGGCGRPLSRYNPESSCRTCVIGRSSQTFEGRQGGGTHPLRRARLRRGMTLETLAGLSGLSPGYLSMLENGRRELSRRVPVTALAAALRVRPVELVPWVLEQPGQTNGGRTDA